MSHFNHRVKSGFKRYPDALILIYIVKSVPRIKRVTFKFNKHKQLDNFNLVKTHWLDQKYQYLIKNYQKRFR